MKPLITNIQRFCVHDGPGIRTTVFLKGCTLRCPWCANPENINFENEVFYIKEKCTKECVHYRVCGEKISNGCRPTTNIACPYNAKIEVGREYDDNELIEELLRDEAYYFTEGGVTFSGGEPLMSLQSYSHVIESLKKRKISLCVESSLYAPKSEILWAVNKIDYFIVDMKLIEVEPCKKILNGDVAFFSRNIQLLVDNVASKRLTIRVPLAANVTDGSRNRKLILEMLKHVRPGKVELFSVHSLANKKYERLGLKTPVVNGVSDEVTSMFSNEITKCGICCEVLRV